MGTEKLDLCDCVGWWDAPAFLCFSDQAEVDQKSTPGVPKGGQPLIGGRWFRNVPQAPCGAYILDVYIYVYIYSQREREREKDLARKQ